MNNIRLYIGGAVMIATGFLCAPQMDTHVSVGLALLWLGFAAEN
jgi:hypothetical protein